MRLEGIGSSELGFRIKISICPRGSQFPSFLINCQFLTSTFTKHSRRAMNGNHNNVPHPKTVKVIPPSPSWLPFRNILTYSSTSTLQLDFRYCPLTGQTINTRLRISQTSTILPFYPANPTTRSSLASATDVVQPQSSRHAELKPPPLQNPTSNKEHQSPFALYRAPTTSSPDCKVRRFDHHPFQKPASALEKPQLSNLRQSTCSVLLYW